VAVLCPQTQDLKCSNVFYVKDGQIDFAPNGNRCPQGAKGSPRRSRPSSKRAR
jgi:hypothetical protein